MTGFAKARMLALLVPGLLMAGALSFQYLGGLYPCEMCHWQRWPHYAAIALTLLAFALRTAPVDRVAVALAALAILTSGAIGAFHAGVEYHWWEGITACAVTSKGTSIAEIMAAPVIACDKPQWELAGISLAGFNFIISTLGGLAILRFLMKGGPTA